MITTTLKRAFFWLSGAGTETLEQCPNWEQRKYVAFGCTVLVPCAFAFIACAYALSTLTANNWVIFSVAAVWAFIILTIDRALLASYRPFMSPIRKLGQFALRFVVAILMGITIAHPLVLLLFRDTISSVIESERAALIETTRDKFDVSKEKVRSNITQLEESIAEQRLKWNESFQAKFIIQEKEDADSAIPGLTADQQKELKAATEEATKPFTDRLTAIEAQSTELTPQYTKLQTELGFWQAEFERELNGQRSGLSGEGPRARSIRSDQLEPRREESKRMGGLLEHLTAEKKALETQIRAAESGAIAAFEVKLKEIELANKAEADRVADLKRKVENDQAASFTTQQNDLRQTIKQQIDTRLEELKRVQEELSRVAADERAAIDAIRAEPRKDVLTQTLALNKLFEAGSAGGKFAYYTYMILTALFMLVDTIPLIVKFFTKSGPYDTLLDRDEVCFESEHKAFLQSQKRYMTQMANSNLIAVTRNKRLEAALIDGVEHSRAAREFIDSMIEMEQAFAEKMRQQESMRENSSAEQIAVLAAMKKSFYDDLHRRMQTFFQPQVG
ncbi:MAG: hypothetical protein B9S37_06785 [Verrucomicrobiia bacterium Tous-C3TDCM]|nr:MAG: hypothetical protein B9S37_06785 [Verrucomicrobiae bacterium Tous-C3TDCM]PAZ05942.1 MAG: hypothetical protein CAK88_06345 [Verrucomicrobiae bacterium AMD-G2]